VRIVNGVQHLANQAGLLTEPQQGARAAIRLKQVEASTDRCRAISYDGQQEAGTLKAPAGTMALRQIHPQIVHHWESSELITLAIDYFAKSFQQPINIPSMARSLGVSLTLLEYHFDHYRGRTIFEALTHYRLNRLCDSISHNPTGLLTEQTQACGFRSVCEANRAFIANFCLDLVQFRNQCLHVAAWRQADQHHPGPATLELVPSSASRTGEAATRPTPFHAST
jgi:AraC-like DNA-binding protein